MIIQLPEDVRFIIHTLQDAGHEAYAVGGCVRDSLLLRTPDDWDITTSARPEETKALFRRTIDTGIQHGTVTVMLKKNGYEVTTYRVDGEYEDGRHPKEVVFTANLIEDLKRRDFTINAMAYNEESGLVDAFSGKRIWKKELSAVWETPMSGLPKTPCGSCGPCGFPPSLAFPWKKKQRPRSGGHAENLRKVSAERIQTELTKLVTSPHPEYLRSAWETGITAVFLPEFDRLMCTPQKNPHHCLNVGEHTLRAMQAVRPDKILRLAMLFHDFGKPDCASADENGTDHFHGHGAVSSKMAEEILKRLRYDNDTIDRVRELVYWHDMEILPEKRAVRRAASKVGKELFPLLLEVKQADLAAQSDYQRPQKEEWLRSLHDIYEQIQEEGDCLSLKDLAVTGRDLIAAGMKPGPQLGQTLQNLLQLVLEDPSRNSKEYLLSNLPKET